MLVEADSVCNVWARVDDGIQFTAISLFRNRLRSNDVGEGCSTSATGIPSSACFSTATICSTENRFLFTTNPSLSRCKDCRKLTLTLGQFPHSSSPGQCYSSVFNPNGT